MNLPNQGIYKGKAYPLHTPKYIRFRLYHRLKRKEFRKAFNINANWLLKNYIDSRLLDTRANINLGVFGGTGTGKSYAAWSIGEYIETKTSVPFTNQSMQFDLAELFEKCRKAKRYETKIGDEQKGFYGEGSAWLITQMDNIEMTVRKKQVNFIYCAPIVRTHHHDYIIETFLTRWFKQTCDVRDPSYIPIGKTYAFLYDATNHKNYTNPLGYVTFSHPKNLEELKKYESRKDIFIDQTLSGNSTTTNQIIENIIKQFYKKELDKICISKKEIMVELRKLAPSGMSGTMIDSMATQIKMTERLKSDP